MTQEQLAQATGLARATIQKAERGGAVRPSVMSRLQEILEPGIPAEQGGIIATAVLGHHGRIHGPITEDDIRRSVTDALVAATDISAADIRSVTRLVIEDLRTRRLLPSPDDGDDI